MADEKDENIELQTKGAKAKDASQTVEALKAFQDKPLRAVMASTFSKNVRVGSRKHKLYSAFRGAGRFVGRAASFVASPLEYLDKGAQARVITRHSSAADLSADQHKMAAAVFSELTLMGQGALLGQPGFLYTDVDGMLQQKALYIDANLPASLNGKGCSILDQVGADNNLSADNVADLKKSFEQGADVGESVAKRLKYLRKHYNRSPLKLNSSPWCVNGDELVNAIKAKANAYAVQQCATFYGLNDDSDKAALIKGVSDSKKSLRATLLQAEKDYNFVYKGQLARLMADIKKQSSDISDDVAMLMALYAVFDRLSALNLTKATLKRLKARIDYLRRTLGQPDQIVNLAKLRKLASNGAYNERKGVIEAIEAFDAKRLYAVVPANSVLAVACDEKDGAFDKEKKRRRWNKNWMAPVGWIAVIFVSIGEGVLPAVLAAGSPLAPVIGLSGFLINLFLFHGGLFSTLRQWGLDGWRRDETGNKKAGWAPIIALGTSAAFCVGFGIVYGFMSFTANTSVTMGIPHIISLLFLHGAVCPPALGIALALIIAVSTGIAVAGLFMTASIQLVNEGKLKKIWGKWKKEFTLRARYPLFDELTQREKCLRRIQHGMFCTVYGIFTGGALFLGIISVPASAGMYKTNFLRAFTSQSAAAQQIANKVADVLVWGLSAPINALFNIFCILTFFDAVYDLGVNLLKLLLGDRVVREQFHTFWRELRVNVGFRMFQVMKAFFTVTLLGLTALNAEGQGMGCQCPDSVNFVKPLMFNNTQAAKTVAQISQGVSSAAPNAMSVGGAASKFFNPPFDTAMRLTVKGEADEAIDTTAADFTLFGSEQPLSAAEKVQADGDLLSKAMIFQPRLAAG
ncbi:MAG: hypothetical protein DHS20C10_08290 [marine bacterium B5-7]|nr:MAG: hypothetical protein DHS20C10_08290 [marine bacterium B5-7]